jgi:hypothetical protein
VPGRPLSGVCGHVTGPFLAGLAFACIADLCAPPGWLQARTWRRLPEPACTTVCPSQVRAWLAALLCFPLLCFASQAGLGWLVLVACACTDRLWWGMWGKTTSPSAALTVRLTA